MAPHIVTVPALRQSHVETMACPEFYRVSVIEGKRMPDSPFSDRGTEIHRIMAQYIDHCTFREVASDWAKFDELAQAAGPEAGPILDGLRDNFTVNWNDVIGVEAKLAVTEDFRPLDAGFAADYAWDQTSALEGTLDVIELSDDLKTATVRDFKSHFRPFDPDTYQSKSYPALVFAHFPAVESVTFELIFVRFRNARRSVTYTREQLPVLQKEMSRRREQQAAIHEQVAAGEPVKALPGPHCVYCPHNARNTCPVAELNPYVNKSIEDRLIFLAWLEKSRAANMEQLRAYVDVAGPVRYEDANGKVYELSHTEVEARYYPAQETLRALEEWDATAPDPALFNGLRISGLTSKLDAKKRAPLAAQLAAVAKVETRVRLALRTPDGEAVVMDQEGF